MSTLLEIEEAITHLPEDERERLEARIVARRFGQDDALEKALAEAIEEADEDSEGGKSPDEVRGLIESWVIKSDSNGVH